MSTNSNKKNVAAQGAPSSQDTTTNSSSVQAAPATAAEAKPAEEAKPTFVKLDPSQMARYNNEPLLARYMNEHQIKAAGLDKDPKTGLPIQRFIANGTTKTVNAVVVAVGPDAGKDVTHLVPIKTMIQKPHGEDGWYGISTCTKMDISNPANNTYGLLMIVPAEDRTKGYKGIALTETRYNQWKEQFVATLPQEERDKYYDVDTLPNIRNTDNHASAKAEVVVKFISKAEALAKKAEQAAKAEKAEAEAKAEEAAKEQTVELDAKK